MHDIRLIRDDPAAFDAAMARRGPYSTDEILNYDNLMRGYLREREALLAEHKAKSREFGEFKRRKEEVPSSLIMEIERIGARLDHIAQDPNQNPDELQRQRDLLLAKLPNVPDPNLPEGKDEAGNVSKKLWGERRKFDFAPASHADFGPALGLDFETGSLISGARFTFLRGPMAQLQRALGQFMLDRQTAAGYTECAPPLLVRDNAVFGTTQLPKFAGDLFFAADMSNRERLFWNAMPADFEAKMAATAEGSFRQALEEMLEKADTSEQYWLIPTSEVSLTNSIREQILADAALPIKMTALTPCFRSEEIGRAHV